MAKVVTTTHPKTYVVLGPGHGEMAGRIKTIPLAENIFSPLIDWKDGVARISTREEKAETGTEFLKKLYEAEGRMDLWAVYEKHREEIAAGHSVKPFPDALLPKKVLQWREESGQPQGPFDAEAYLASMKKADAPSTAKGK